MILDTLWKKLCFKKKQFGFFTTSGNPPPVWQKTILFHTFFWTLPLWWSWCQWGKQWLKAKWWWWCGWSEVWNSVSHTLVFPYSPSRCVLSFTKGLRSLLLATASTHWQLNLLLMSLQSTGSTTATLVKKHSTFPNSFAFLMHCDFCPCYCAAGAMLLL